MIFFVSVILLVFLYTICIAFIYLLFNYFFIYIKAKKGEVKLFEKYINSASKNPISYFWYLMKNGKILELENGKIKKTVTRQLCIKKIYLGLFLVACILYFVRIFIVHNING